MFVTFWKANINYKMTREQKSVLPCLKPNISSNSVGTPSGKTFSIPDRGCDMKLLTSVAARNNIYDEQKLTYML